MSMTRGLVLASMGLIMAGCAPKFSCVNKPNGPGCASVSHVYAEMHDVPLVLGVGASFMALSTPQEVRERVRHYVEIGGKGGRFALYLCNLGATTPPENVRAAVEAARTYGRYD